MTDVEPNSYKEAQELEKADMYRSVAATPYIERAGSNKSYTDTILTVLKVIKEERTVVIDTPIKFYHNLGRSYEFMGRYRLQGTTKWKQLPSVFSGVVAVSVSTDVIITNIATNYVEIQHTLGDSGVFEYQIFITSFYI